MGAIRVGISGWRYAGWTGVFYPERLPSRRQLEFASRAFPTIELNGSFYSLQTPESYASWYRATPPGFVFSVKGGRYITHFRRLREIEQPLANFYASGLLNLREKLGPSLWQFPPQLAYDEERFDRFLTLLPRDTEQALALARRRDAWMKGRVRLAIDQTRPLRHAVEIRHRSFLCASFAALLRKHGTALVVADTAQRWPLVGGVTADFVYVRLHGAEELYASGYTDESLERWAARMRAWSSGDEPADVPRLVANTTPAASSRDVYCYFDNDAKVRAPFDARTLMRKLDLEPDDGFDFPAANALERVPANTPGIRPDDRWSSFGRRQPTRRKASDRAAPRSRR